MARVKFTPNLVRFFPDLRECEVEATTIADSRSARSTNAGAGWAITSSMSRGLCANTSISSSVTNSSATSRRSPTRYPPTQKFTSCKPFLEADTLRKFLHVAFYIIESPLPEAPGRGWNGG